MRLPESDRSLTSFPGASLNRFSEAGWDASLYLSLSTQNGAQRRSGLLRMEARLSLWDKSCWIWGALVKFGFDFCNSPGSREANS